MCSFCKTNKADYIKIIELKDDYRKIKFICSNCILKFKEKNSQLNI